MPRAAPALTQLRSAPSGPVLGASWGRAPGTALHSCITGLWTPQGDQSCVSSRVSGLQEASLLLQLLFRLWELLATWARGSERMRYLWEGRRALASCSAQEARLDTLVGVRCPSTWQRAGFYACLGTRYLHDVVGLQPRVGRGVDEHIGEGVLVVIHLVCGGDRARRVVTPQPLPTSAPPGPEELAAPVSCRILLAIPPEPRLGEPSLAGPP